MVTILGNTAENGNPNLCSDCCNPSVFSKGHLPFATGVCGSCNRVRHVWDFPHLALLRAKGLRFSEQTADQPTAAVGVLRNSYLEQAQEDMF